MMECSVPGCRCVERRRRKAKKIISMSMADILFELELNRLELGSKRLLKLLSAASHGGQGSKS
jgi:hypothetical protein